MEPVAAENWVHHSDTIAKATANSLWVDSPWADFTIASRQNTGTVAPPELKVWATEASSRQETRKPKL